MPVIHTRSADPLDRITLEKGRDDTMHVWLRDNIAEAVGDDVGGERSGNAIPVWEADEVYFHSDFPVLLEDVEADFDRLWALHSAPEVVEPTPEVMVARMEETLLGFTRVLLEDTGRAPGEKYVPPTGYHDAYPKGWEVQDDGAEWIATRNGATEIPGEGFDWVRKTPENEIPIWAPVQAGSEHAVGVIVSHKGRLYRNDHTGPNGWEPGTTGSQWTDIGPA